MNSFYQSVSGAQYCSIAGICVIMLLSFERISRRMSDNSPLNLNFRLSILFSALGALMDIPYGLREFIGIEFSIAVCYLSEMLYFLSGTLSAFFWFRYSEMSQDSPLFRKKALRVLLSLPAAVIVVLTFTTPFHHLNFYFENGHYVRGVLSTPISILVLLLTISSGIAALLRSFQKENYINRGKFRLLFLYAVGCPMIELLQICFGSVMPFRSVGTAAVFLIITMRGIQQNVTLDSLTGINNRFAMDRYLMGKFAAGGSFRLMMLDINDFKEINDKHGHIVGDQALQLTAAALLRSVPGNAFVCRYGGDEFAIIANSGEEEFLQIEERIRQNLNETVEENGLPFALSACTGCALKDGSVATIPDLIRAADAMLYEKKKIRKQSMK